MRSDGPSGSSESDDETAGATDAARSEPAPTTGFAGVVAMDGPSGTGKSTVARRLAGELGARYLDTGAMYRAATLAVLRAGLDLGDPTAITDLVTHSRIDISTNPEIPAISLDGARVDAEIRSAEVTAAVSAVSAVREVRALLVRAQRALIGAGGIVVEGRDIGTVVWPDARPKIYLTASEDARARRRAGELGGADVHVVAADIARRDGLDSSRAASPLAKAADALEIDTTQLSVDEVVNRLVDIIQNVRADV
jgi:cytidylate kinase